MTLEDEAEQLDWGNEDDEQMAHKGVDPRVEAEDAEDAISLGSQEDDYYVYQPRPSQQDAPRALSTPKSTSFSQQQQFSHQATRELQRENSTNSQKQFSHPQSSPQQSPHRSSFSKITHALPPKPVVSNVPFLHPSHPSIIEATAMAAGRSDRDKKANGNIIKPGDAGELLPPDWEVRQPRSGGRGGIYFYNIRTHESTWTRPVSSWDKEKGRAPPSESRSVGKLGFDIATSAKSTEHSRRPEADSQVSSVELTYEDRHYRPGAEPSIDSSKRDERPSQVSPYDPNPFTPPKPDRPLSPLQRSRDSDPLKRSGRQSSPRHLPDGHGSVRAHTRDNILPERHWGQSREPPAPTENSSRRRATPSHARQQDRDVDISLSTPAFEDRNSHNDAVWSSAPRHRSPAYFREIQPPYAPQASQTSVSVPPPTSATVPRQKSRFDRPANPSQNALRSRDHDVYVPVDAAPQRHREHELTFVQINTENAVKRVDVDDHGRPSDAISNHRIFQAETTPASHPERLLSASPSPPASLTEQSHQPKRYRQPLPPQSTRFRDMFRAPNDPGSPVLASQAPLGPRDGGIVQRSVIVNNNVPSGPRLQPQPQPVRDASHPDFAQGPRIPPSGPSATTSSRARPSRSSNETAFIPNESPALRDRDSMDVDSVPPSRAPPLRTDIPIRAGSGMYADREQANDVLPKAPRAMAKIPIGNAHLLPGISPSTSPTTPFSAQRSASGQEHGSDRERSPPPRDRWAHSRGLPERRHSQPVSTTVRPEQAWRSDIPRDDTKTSPAAHDVEINQLRGEQSNIQNRHHNELGRQTLLASVLKLSDTNSVPIGNRKAGVNSQLAMPSPIIGSRRGPLSGGNVEPARVSRGGIQPKESYERSPQFGLRPLPSEQSNRPTLLETLSGHRRRNGHSAQPFERGLAPPADTSTSVRSYYAHAEPSRYERPPSPEPPRSASRVWMPRVPSPSGVAIRRASSGAGGDYRAPTPPPLSREPSWDEPSFGPSDQTRSTNRYPDNTRLQNRLDTAPRPVTMVADHSRRQHDIAANRDRDRERFGPDTVRSGGSVGLQDRLGERYDDRYTDSLGHYRPHVSPHIRRQHEEYINEPPHQVHSDHRGRSYPFSAERTNDDWTSAMGHREPNTPMNLRSERVRMFDDIPLPDDAPSHSSKAVRIRRTPSTSHPRQSFDIPMYPDFPIENMGNNHARDHGRDIDRGLPEPPHSYERPHVLRRGGSLLDRLSLDDAAGSSAGAMGSPSLRERVQIPMKRDREEMSGGDSHSVDASFDYDDGGDSAKRNRRRSGKPRRGGKTWKTG